ARVLRARCGVWRGRFLGFGAAKLATSPPASIPATSTTPIETYQRIAALPSNDSDGDMLNGRRKALKSFVLHMRVRIGFVHTRRAVWLVPPPVPGSEIER